MKNKFRIIVIIIALIAISKVNAQNCVFWYPATVGTSWEMTEFDESGSMTGTSNSKVTAVDNVPAGYDISIEMESFDVNHASQGVTNYVMSCKNGVFYVNMAAIIEAGMKAVYADMNVSIEASELAIPGDLKVGSKLDEGTLKMKLSGMGMPSMEVSVRMYNRKVESLESVTTNAGTFDCYKITYEVETIAMGNTTKTLGIDWISKETGVVRSENRDANSKLLGYSLLTKFTK